jgi:hypothetical protein
MQAVIYRRRKFKNWRLEIPDFAYDKHTQKGVADGQGSRTFAARGLQAIERSSWDESLRSRSDRAKRNHRQNHQRQTLNV